MKDHYYPQTYKRDDGVIEKHYIWLSKLKTAKHKAEDGTTLTAKHLYFEPEVETPNVLTKMTRTQIKADRTKRSKADFQKNILPTFHPKSIEGKHFAKKASKKKS